MKTGRSIIKDSVAVCIVALSLAGCSSGPPPLASVKGRVTFEGRPLSKVRVEFIPELPTGDRYLRSLAQTNDNGEFEMYCDDGRPGAVIGWHRVVLATDSRSIDRSRNPFEPESGRDSSSSASGFRIPRTYNSVATTPERHEVKLGEENKFEFKVTRR